MSAAIPIFHESNIGLVSFNETLLRHIEEGDNGIVLSIIQGEDLCQLTSSLGTTLLHFAAQYGNQWLTRHFIDSGLDVDVQNLSQETPLMYAVNGNRKETVELLLEANADIFLPDVAGECTLAKVFSGTVSEEISQMILKKVTVKSLSNSPCVNAKSFHENCPLYHFITLNNVALTRILLEKGSPVNVKKPYSGGETVLHQVVQQMDHEHVKLLLEFNADVNAKKYDHGKTPLAFCCVGGESNETIEIVKSLLAAGAVMIDRPNRRIMVQSILTTGRIETVRVLLQNQLDLHFGDGLGWTSLHYLAKNPTPNILRELLDGLDFDVNIRCTTNGFTLLHSAAQAINPSSILFLLERGAGVDVEDGFRKTSLYRLMETLIATRRRLRRSVVDDALECMDLLLDAGADCQIFKEGLYRENLCNFEPFNDQAIEILSSLIADFALAEASGRIIDEGMQTEVESCKQLRSIFIATKLQFEEFKRINIGKSVTLCDFFTANDERISLFARNSRLASNLKSALKKYNLDAQYNRRLRQRFLTFTRLVKMRKKVAIVINEIFAKFCNVSVGNVAALIVSYLLDQDLHTILSITM